MLFTAGIQLHPRERPELAGELLARLVEMVLVKVQVAEGVDEFAGRRSQTCATIIVSERIGGDVERHAEEQVGAALVKLAAQLAVADVKLEEHMAGRQRHLVDAPRRSRRSRSGGGSRGFRFISAMTLSIWLMTAPSAPRQSRSIARRKRDRARPVSSAHSSQIVTPFSFKERTFVSPCRNQSSSWMIDLRWSFFVVSSGKPPANRTAPARRRPRACRCPSGPLAARRARARGEGDRDIRACWFS